MTNVIGVVVMIVSMTISTTVIVTNKKRKINMFYQEDSMAIYDLSSEMIKPRMLSDTIVSPIQYFPFINIKIDLESISHIIYPSENVYIYSGGLGGGDTPKIGFTIYFRSDIPIENKTSSKFSRSWRIPGESVESDDDDTKFDLTWSYNVPHYRKLLVERVDEISALWEKVKLQYLAN
jgi:hypothetical protein